MPFPDDDGHRPWNRSTKQATPHHIPLAVRRKLVESGQELEADEWQRLPAAARYRLEHMPCESSTHRRTFATLVDWLRLTFITPGRATVRHSVPGPGTWPWQLDQAPERVGQALAAAGLDWQSLDIDQRFGLIEAASNTHPDALERYVEELCSVSGRGSVVA